jgi:hypothetical protein
MGTGMTIRVLIAFVVCGGVLAAAPAHAQSEDRPPANGAPTGAIPAPVPPAPFDSARPALPPAAEEKPPQSSSAETRPPESPAAESKPNDNQAAETRPPDSAESRYTFSRVQDGYVRLDNRTGQVSFCSKRTVGWTCQLAPEDRGALENEIARLQEENAGLKKEFLRRGLPLPGGAKAEPPVAQNDRTFTLPTDPNLDRMKVFVEKVWRRLVDLIVTLQKDVLKKS